MKELNYNDRLKQLGLQRLEGRRISDLIETFKIVNRKGASILRNADCGMRKAVKG